MPEATAGESKKPHRILVVDDEPDLERLVRQRMRREVRTGQYLLEFAQNGVEALEKLSEDRDRFDMVLSDINMPQMDGLTLLQQIRQVDPDVRAVIVSAYGDMKNIRTAMNRGAFDFVTKPIDFDDLRVTIERTLRNLEEWRHALASRDQLVKLENELGLARQMQRSILPKYFPSGNAYEVYASMEPVNAVGGDFYDLMPLDGGKMGIAIADVSGKGIPAALFMMSSRTLLKGSAIGTDSPSEALVEANNILCDENSEMMFVTVLYAVYDPRTGNFSFGIAGHDSPILVRADGEVVLLPRAEGIALGVLRGFDFESKSVALQPGDTVILYTDGITEARNDAGDMFGVDGLRKLFAGSPPATAREAIERVFAGVRDFAGAAQQFDDITCLALRRNGEPS